MGANCGVPGLLNLSELVSFRVKEMIIEMSPRVPGALIDVDYILTAANFTLCSL